MSQWVHATSKVMENVDQNIMQRAFERMHLGIDRSVKTIQNTWGSDTVDFGLRDKEDNNNLLDIGMKVQNGKAEVRGDFYFSRWKNQDEFVDEFSRNYQRCNIEDTALINGYEIETEKVNEDGSIELCLMSNAF